MSVKRTVTVPVGMSCRTARSSAVARPASSPNARLRREDAALRQRAGMSLDGCQCRCDVTSCSAPRAGVGLPESPTERRSSGTAPSNHGGSHEHQRPDHHRDPSLPRRHSRREARRAAPSDRRSALALRGAGGRSVAGRAAGDNSGARALLGERLRLAQGRGEAERAAAVHDRDRRGRHPLHPRPLAARERAAADHDARLARLGHGAARHRRPAHRPDRSRRRGRGRISPRPALHARLRLLQRADGSRVERRPRRAGVGGADAPTRLHPLRRPGRRRGRRGIHVNVLVRVLGGPQPTESDEERAAQAQLDTFRESGSGYFLEMATRPQTIGYALLDSPVALAAWMLDHDTDSYYKIAGAFVDGKPTGNLTRDHILDNITLYWLTGTGASAARSYWEAYGPDAPAAGRQ